MIRLLYFIFVLAIAVPGKSAAQKLTGIWKGYFITESGEQYKLEFQIQQSKSNAVTGVSYSYLDKRFYGKASMTGNVVLKEKEFKIQETRTTEVRNLGGGGTCLMNYRFIYSRSGKEEFLEGTYVGKSEDRKNPANNGEWGDCGGGKVFLRRVATSDFYVEPFLRDIPITKKANPAPSKPIVKTTPKPPAPNKAVVKNTKPPVTSKPAIKQPVKKPATPPANNTVAKKTTEVSKTETPEPKKEEAKVIVPKKVNAPVKTRSRENELIKTLTVRNEEIIVRLYDNGEIDDDTISVYLDDMPVLSAKRLSANPLTITLKVTENEPEHVLVMVAENLGRIPPNTSLMIVHDGDKRYEVRITSTEQKNAMVRFRYVKEEK